MTCLRAELATATAARAEAQQAARIAAAEVGALRDVWSPLHSRVEAERSARIAAQLALASTQAELEGAVRDRDAAQKGVGWFVSLAWRLTKPIRRVLAIPRQLRRNA